MSKDNVEYLVIDYDDQLDSVVDSVNYILQDYGLVFEEDDDKNNESYENGDGRMWWTLKEIDRCVANTENLSATDINLNFISRTGKKNI